MLKNLINRGKIKRKPLEKVLKENIYALAKPSHKRKKCPICGSKLFRFYEVFRMRGYGVNKKNSYKQKGIAVICDSCGDFVWIDFNFED